MSGNAGYSLEELERLLKKVEDTISSQAELIDELRRKIAEFEKRLGKNSSLPPSSDRFQKPAKSECPNRKARRALGRRPGKQPGTEGKHFAHVENPDVVVTHTPGCCDRFGRDLADSPVEGPRSARSSICPSQRRCARRSTGQSPGAVTAAR